MKTNTTEYIDGKGNLHYFTGDIALGLERTPGTWDDNVFTSEDGRKWVMCDPYDDTRDNSGIVYLKPYIDLASGKGAA